MLKETLALETSDGKLFKMSDIDEARSHKQFLTIKNLEGKFIAKARKIFKVHGGVNEERFIISMEEQTRLNCSIDDFEEFVGAILDMLVIYKEEIKELQIYLEKAK